MADGIINKDQLLALTLRQLRQEASKLSVPLYSRKTKSVLVDLIIKYQKKRENIKKAKNNVSDSTSEIKNDSNISYVNEEVKTNVVFLLKEYIFSCFFR